MRALAATMVLILLASLPANATQDPAAIRQAIADTRLEPGRAVTVENLEIVAAMASFQIEEGTVFLATPVGDRVAEMVFVGKARLVLDPPDEIEAGQLELYTGGVRLDEPVSEAALVVAFDAAVDAVSDRPAAVDIDPARQKRAQEIFDRWQERPERRLLGVENAILGDAVGDPLYDGFFAGWFRGEELGEFLYLEEPDAYEQINLGQFTPIEASDKEKRKLARSLHRAQRRGRLIGLSVEDLGQWDTWISASTPGANGEPRPGRRAFEPRLYELDLTLSEPNLALTGRARLHLEALSRVGQVVELEIHSDLRIDHARSQDGTDLFFHQSGSEVLVVLPAAPAAGDVFLLEIDYSGQLIDKGESKTFVLRNTTHWYPHAGTLDLAPYDVTFHWPAGLDLRTAGTRVAGGEEVAGRRFERRRLEHPTFAFSFELGHFKTLTGRAGHVEVSLSFDRLALPLISRKSREELLSTLIDAVVFFEETFGPYPLDELVVVTAPRTFSQSFLGFMTLATTGMSEADWLSVNLGLEDRRTVVAHEVAHQWWGHMVAWKSYRDQWISEALANYAAVIYARHRLRDDGPLFIGPTTGWQTELTRKTADGRPIESIGPLVLGERLSSSHSTTDAYVAIVYKKGAVVIDMLARFFQEETFLEILRTLVEFVSFRAISTEEFVTIIGHLSSMDLSAFAQQYIFATGLPEIYYTYDFEPTAAGTWLVTGEARQESPWRLRYRVVEHKDGSLDVARERLDQINVTSSVLAVPLQIEIYDPAESTGDFNMRREVDPQVPGNAILTGRLLLKGKFTEIRLELDHEPKELWLDKNEEVFGRFFNEHRHPKRMLLRRGVDLAAAGDHGAGEETYRRALAAEFLVGPDYQSSESEDTKREERWLDANIQLELAWLCLNQDRMADARAAFEEVQRLLTPSSPAWLQARLRVLEARLAIRCEDYARAYKLLRKMVQKGDGSAEALLLFAIAARATGHSEDFESALAAARDKGADIAALSLEQ